MALLVEIWFTWFNSAGKTWVLRKSLPFFFFPVPIVFYPLYTSTQCLLSESSKNRAKQVGLRAFSGWQESDGGWWGRTSSWASRFLCAVAWGCCTGEAGQGCGPSALGPHFHIVFRMEKWVQAQDNKDQITPVHLKTCSVYVYAYMEYIVHS